MSGWGKARVVLCAFAVLQGMIIPFGSNLGLPEPPLSLSAASLEFVIPTVIFPLVFFPVAGLFVIGIQARNPFSNPKWTVPHWNSRFINFGDPLHFFHFAGFMVPCTSIGMLLVAPFCDRVYWVEMLTFITGGLGVLLSVSLCKKVYRDKFENPEEAPKTNVQEIA